MTFRGVSAILFALIVAAEVFFFMKFDVPANIITTQETSNKGSGFSRFLNTTTTEKTIIDKTQQEQRNQKYMVLIGSTILVGFIVTFALPNHKLQPNKKEDDH